MIRDKMELIDVLEDIFYELAAQDMAEVTLKDVFDYAYRNRKNSQTEDKVSLIILKKYLKELKETANEER